MFNRECVYAENRSKFEMHNSWLDTRIKSLAGWRSIIDHTEKNGNKSLRVTVRKILFRFLFEMKIVLCETEKGCLVICRLFVVVLNK